MNWEDLSFPAQVGIIAGVAVVIIVIFYFLYVQSTQDQIEAEKRQITKLNEDIEEGKKVAARLNEFKQEVKKLQDRFELFKEIIPENIEYDVILKYLNTIASETAIVIRTMNPQKLIPVGFYAEYPIRMKMIGSYHNLINFYLKIKNLKRIINVTNMTLERRSFNRGDQDLDKPISIDCTASTFLFLAPDKRKGGAGARGRVGGAQKR